MKLKYIYLPLAFLILNGLTVSLNGMFEHDATRLQDKHSTVKNTQIHNIEKHTRKPFARYLAYMYQKTKLNAKSAWQNLQNNKITKITALKGAIGLIALAATTYAALQPTAQQTSGQATASITQKIKKHVRFRDPLEEIREITAEGKQLPVRRR